MTKSEKKDTDSEISGARTHLLQEELQDLCAQIYYTTLGDSGSGTVHSPIDGYVHLILLEERWSVAYDLDRKPFVLRCCENAIHRVSKDTVLEWKSLSEETVAILLFIPELHRLGIVAPSNFEIKASSGQGLVSKNSQQLSSIARRLYMLSTETDVFSPLHLRILALEILLCQLREYHSEEVNHVANTRKNYYEMMQEVKRLIEQDVSKNYTISELAKEVGTNEQYIKKYFKQYYGETVTNYATSMKMEHAKRLIMTGEYRISDVAQMVGYRHATHFTTAFKKYFGFIPNSLRFSFWWAVAALGMTGLIAIL